MTVRPFESSDLDAVASLYQRVMRGQGEPPAALRRWFERVAIEGPGHDPEIPSLVAEGKGGVDGFLISHVRPISIDGASARLGCSGPLVVDPSARSRALGAILLRSYLAGPQALTITDGATEHARLMWERLGGELGYPQSIEWVKPLKPGSFGAAMWARARRRASPGKAVSMLGQVADSAAAIPSAARWASGRGAGRMVGLDPVVARTEPLTPSRLASALSQVAARRRLRPAYDEELAGWLLTEMEAVRSRGQFRAALVVDASEGGPIGWYAYYLAPSGLSPVVSVAARDEAAAGTVLDTLFADARRSGVAGLKGRLEPSLAAPAGARGCLFRYIGEALVHASSPEILALSTSRHALLTRMDGEWWMDPHLLDAGEV